MQYRISQLLAIMLLSFTLNSAHASAVCNTKSLQLTDNGLGIFDYCGNDTWTQDANLLGSKEQADSSYVAKIISSIGSITDSAGVHTLTTADFGAGGLVDWYAGQAFVAYMDKTNYGGSNQWALPYTINLANPYNYPPPADSSQLAELFYSELGGVAGSSIPAGPFSNTQIYAYWSATEPTSYPNLAFRFATDFGTQNAVSKSVMYYAWAVSPGQVGQLSVSTVPLPSAVWLFASTLAGVIGFKRRKTV
jgi:hypothetical protein